MPDQPTAPDQLSERFPNRTWMMSQVTGKWVFQDSGDTGFIVWRRDGSYNVTNPEHWTIQDDSPWQAGVVMGRDDSIRLPREQTADDAALSYALGHLDTHEDDTPDEGRRLSSPLRLIPRIVISIAILAALFVPALALIGAGIITMWVLADILGNIWRPYLEAFTTRHQHHGPECEHTHE